MKQAVIGLAGHIDHGKTALVKALTGVNTDSLTEEQKRGMTIDIGFAFLDENITLIDVPGHEKFVKNMMAGVSSVDIALLVIAADDGVMPQTREHFEILNLLNIPIGVIAINKIDLTDEEARAYEAPYPTGEYKAGAHVWPYLIPTQLSENEEYWVKVYEKWDKPFLVAFGGEERVTIRMKDDFLNRIPNPTVVTLEGVGHFVQEEVGPELAALMNDFIAGKPVRGFSRKR